MFRRTLVVLAFGVAFCSTSWAQSFGYDSGVGWSFGAERLYQDSTDLSAEG